jgi:hypothetical protein
MFILVCALERAIGIIHPTTTKLQHVGQSAIIRVRTRGVSGGNPGFMLIDCTEQRDCRWPTMHSQSRFTMPIRPFQKQLLQLQLMILLLLLMNLLEPSLHYTRRRHGSYFLLGIPTMRVLRRPNISLECHRKFKYH